MYPIDHHHRGGEGRAPIDKKSLQPPGVILRLEVGKKYSDSFILCHHK